MKKNKKYIKLIGIFVLALVISASCAKWEQETSPKLDAASEVTLAVLSVGDSSVVVGFSNSSNGYVSLNLYDGTGNPIFMIFPEYHQNFVYDSNYIKPEIIGFNVEVSSGNAINNIAGVYSEGVMIEYYFSGFDPQYGGLDWRSIRLVFIQDNLSWYLVAIIHGEWTI